MPKLSDTVITLSKELVETGSGLAFDIGGSIAKIVYRSNKEYKNGQPIDPKAHKEGKGNLHLAMFLRDQVDDIIHYILDNCDLHRNDDGNATVYATGVGSSENKEKFIEKLNVKLTETVLTHLRSENKANVGFCPCVGSCVVRKYNQASILKEAIFKRIVINDEFNMFVKAFILMRASLPNEELVHPKSKKAEKKVESLKKMLEGFAQMQTEKGNEGVFMKARQEDAEEEDEGKHLPALLVMCGSGSGIMLAREDGTFSLIDGLTCGGRFFLGLMNQLVGIKDFPQLMDIAEKSDGRSIDVYTSDFELSGTADNNTYDMMSEYSEVVYHFGKGYTKKQGEPKKGDMIRSILSVMASSHIQVALLTAVIQKVKDVYFCGNLVNAAIVRELMEIEEAKRNVFAPTPDKKNINFLKNGGMYGALGCYFYKPEPDCKTGEAEEPTVTSF